jgi:hypothetical protein
LVRGYGKFGTILLEGSVKGLDWWGEAVFSWCCVLWRVVGSGRLMLQSGVVFREIEMFGEKSESRGRDGEE